MNTIRSKDLLTVSELTVRFGAVTAVSQVSFELIDGEFLAIVGPNGAGKTTLLNAISGLVRIDGGNIQVRTDQGHRNLVRTPPHKRASLGISRTFQHSKLFQGLSVIDHILCGAYVTTPHGLHFALVRSAGMLADERRLWLRSEELLAELGLNASASLPIEQLPGPHRRLVDLGRALISNPRILLLDEIAAGTTEEEKERIIALLRERHRKSGMSVILIEHDLEFVRRLADSLVVLVEGRMFSSGAPEEVLSRSDVLAAYVGEG